MASFNISEIRDPAARVRALCDYGLHMTEVDCSIPAKRYVRSGKEIIRMAEVYEEEGELEKAFILYNKFTTLFVEKLPNHPGYKSVPQDERTSNRKMLNKVFPKAMSLKDKLTEKYTAEETLRQAEERRLKELSDKAIEQKRIEDEKKRFEDKKKLDEESRRREEQEARILLETQNQFRQMQLQEQSRIDSNRSGRTVVNTNIATITIGDIEPTSPLETSAYTTPSPPFDPSPLPPPSVPPPSYSYVIQDVPSVPSRTLKPTDMATGIVMPPSVDRSNKPSSFDHFTSVGDSGMKPIHVPEDLVPLFLQRAFTNTNRSIETCGILCGKLKSSKWYVTHLLIPEQSGTTDSCDIMNEESLVDFQDKHNLVTLGWIHAPRNRMNAYLKDLWVWANSNILLYAVPRGYIRLILHKLPSSPVLINTHIGLIKNCCRKQSPSYVRPSSMRYFYLTPDFGMEYVRNCSGKGFHEHPSHPPMFETCPNVHIDQYSKIAITDLRMRSGR